MCPADLSEIAKGYSLRHRDEWEKSLIIANTWLQKPLTYADLFKTKATKNLVTSKEEWEEFVKKFRHKRKDDG